jgi:hypothetical protein
MDRTNGRREVTSMGGGKGSGRGGGVLGDRIFWVACVSCEGKFYCEHELLDSSLKLICPYCATEFQARESKWLEGAD